MSNIDTITIEELEAMADAGMEISIEDGIPIVWIRGLNDGR